MGSAFPASADLVTYTFDSFFPGPNDVVEFGLPQFNPKLGTLESVSIDASAVLSGSMSVTNQAGDDEFDGCNCALIFGGTNSAGDSLTAITPDTIASGLLSPGESATIPWSGGVSGEFGINSILPYTGTSEITFDLSAFVAASFVTHNTSFGITLDPSPFTVDVNYSFTPSPVPEPAPVGVTAAILCAIVWRAWLKFNECRPHN